VCSFTTLEGQRLALNKRPKQAALGTTRWKRLRIATLDRDGWVCAVCGLPATTADHIYPRSKGGDMWALDNLQSLCAKCNSSKGSRFFIKQATPPVFPAVSLPDTVRAMPASPFSKPD